MTDRSLGLLIDEVALGLADDDDVARLEAMAAADPIVAARLDHARATFALLDDTADPLPLPEDIWKRIDQSIDLAEAETAPVAANVSGQRASKTEESNVIELGAVRAQLSRWRLSAFAGLAAAVVLAVALSWTVMSPKEPAVIAVLLNDQGDAVALIEGRPDNTTRVTLLERPDVAANQVMQVWTKPDADGPPVSLGLLETGESRTLTIQGLPAPNAQQLYEITTEPAGGSPTNLPTGPILGKGLAKEPVI
ncbi:anti-sigma factor [Donghicola eburneus]|uniref:Anti-sigma K factor RskA C-terminal domain-containing protein n=1 Tax=Donghicola eburneus TaxID=393278 RepID=A0A1M4MVD6_9RHOB|nr:anti-sigma factor [Donghicola eburneus]SCM66290.1 hypothetical protein KARMA_0464 [Donghicola eburneus]